MIDGRNRSRYGRQQTSHLCHHHLQPLTATISHQSRASTSSVHRSTSCSLLPSSLQHSKLFWTVQAGFSNRLSVASGYSRIHGGCSHCYRSPTAQRFAWMIY